MSETMKIIYISSLCSTKKYCELFNESQSKSGSQIQKYHKLMVMGFSKNKNIEIVALSALPIIQKESRKFYFKRNTEAEEGIEYTYLPFINFLGLRHLLLFFSSFITTLKMCDGNKNTIIICDALNISISTGGLLAAKIMQKKNVCIVTDVPGFLADNSKEKITKIKRVLSKLTTKINNLIINQFGLYVFLTKQMNELLNKKKRPYTVLEGHVDIEMKDIVNCINEKYEKKVCLYAGSLKKIYGIKMLTDAFIKANIGDAELHIYGSGNFEDDLREICKLHENIKYFGVKLNDCVVQEQLKASLLINPRPTNEEYTKYSFPSKNMEYMASGTPTLTTKLPGMPKEYNDYVYLIGDESVEGLAKIIKDILSKTKEELHEKGRMAKEFVLCEKNNIVQSSKIVDMINAPRRK